MGKDCNRCATINGQRTAMGRRIDPDRKTTNDN
jgi:hypothetical protein